MKFVCYCFSTDTGDFFLNIGQNTNNFENFDKFMEYSLFIQ